jgi:hypothetical protein
MPVRVPFQASRRACSEAQFLPRRALRFGSDQFAVKASIPVGSPSEELLLSPPRVVRRSCPERSA